ncbi:MAG: hypothetical protein IPG46_17100 [Actinobacteria bacterium]|nr:hypothetical protein [Actinomycetota bacterium]
MNATLTTLAGSDLVAQFDGRNGDYHHDGPGFLLLPIILGLIAFGFANLRRARRGAECPNGFGPWGAGGPRGPHGPRFGGPFGPGGPGSNTPARTFLDERFARGEIDSETYLHQVATLRRADEGAWGAPPQPAAQPPADREDDAAEQ